MHEPRMRRCVGVLIAFRILDARSSDGLEEDRQGRETLELEQVSIRVRFCVRIHPELHMTLCVEITGCVAYLLCVRSTTSRVFASLVASTTRTRL